MEVKPEPGMLREDGNAEVTDLTCGQGRSGGRVAGGREERMVVRQRLNQKGRDKECDEGQADSRHRPSQV